MAMAHNSRRVHLPRYRDRRVRRAAWTKLCGKTTTLRLIAGLVAPDAGSIAIDSKTVSAPEQNVFARPEDRDIGMVFQSYAIWPTT